MNPKEYVKNTLVTEAQDLTLVQERIVLKRNLRLIHAQLGFSSELSEIREAVLKDEIDFVNLKEEFGDMYWYMGIAIDELGSNPEFIMDAVKQDSVSGLSPNNAKSALEDLVDNMDVIIGRFSDLMKKSIMYGKPLSVTIMEGELIALDKNIALALSVCGFSPEEAREVNISKLRARYGEKFTEAAALERNLAKERDILEGKGNL